jgi:hypothetical protein
MPGFLTHYLAGQAVLAKLPAEIESLILADRNKIFTLGAEGSDIFFYYVPGLIRPRTRGIGSDIHNAKFNPFFIHMARLCKRVKNEEQRETLFAYLAGFLVHYTVDVHAHPFVNAHTRHEGATELQETAEHRHFETALDVLMLARLTAEKPADYKQWELIQAPAGQKRIAAAAFAAAATKVYSRKILPQDVYHAMGHMAALTRMLHSPKGRRKHFAAFLEDKTIGARVFSAMVHMQELTDGRDYLNLSRAYWGEQNTSFPELFDAAVAEAVALINGLYAYMHGTLSREVLTALIGFRSLSTGEITI